MGVRQICAGTLLGSGSASFPAVVEAIAVIGASQGDDVVGATDGPVHAAVLQAVSDD